MSKQILVARCQEKIHTALMDGKRLLYISNTEGSSIEPEQFYLCTVDRIVRGTQSCFVRMDKKNMGYLPFSECEKIPVSGERLLLQVKKGPLGEKVSYLTALPSLAGRYVILAPGQRRYSVSKRIEDAETRKKLYSLCGKLCPENDGLIMRAESAEADEETLSAEVAALSGKWQAVRQNAARRTSPGLVMDTESALSRLLRDEHGEIECILTNCPDEIPLTDIPVRFCEQPFELFAVEDKLQKSLRRKIWLDCGGFIIIDRTEAMTVIDVNSGKYNGSKSGTEATFTRLNMEAAAEIARILRLRSIGGIIIIDFVDMENEESRALVTGEMKKALADDPVKTVIHGFTSLGLMEMTRVKKGGDLPGILTPCPHCGGTGYLEENE